LARISSRTRLAEAGRHAPKGDESYEASDLRILLIDSPDPEVRTNLRRFARLESRLHSDEQAASPQAKNRMSADSRFLTYQLYAVCPFCLVYRPVSAMRFDRNLRLASDLNNSREFSRLRLWTPGKSENAGIIRARSDPEWYPKNRHGSKLGDSSVGRTVLSAVGPGGGQECPPHPQAVTRFAPSLNRAEKQSFLHHAIEGRGAQTIGDISFIRGRVGRQRFKFVSRGLTGQRIRSSLHKPEPKRIEAMGGSTLVPEIGWVVVEDEVTMSCPAALRGLAWPDRRK
jgi:hypothetical protein